MLLHLITTTSECRVQECLAKHSVDNDRAFVLTNRVPNDESHVRYDVFLVQKREEH